MNLTMRECDIVSSSTLVRNYVQVKEQVKVNGKAYVFKNNSLDMILVDPEEYKTLLSFKEAIEDHLTLLRIEDRKKTQKSYKECPEDYMVDEEIFDFIESL